MENLLMYATIIKIMNPLKELCQVIIKLNANKIIAKRFHNFSLKLFDLHLNTMFARLCFCVTFKVTQCLTKRKFLAKFLPSQQAYLNDSVGLVDLKLDIVRATST